MDFVSTDEFSGYALYFPLDVFEKYLKKEMGVAEVLPLAKDTLSFSEFRASSSQINLLYNLLIEKKRVPLEDADIECLAWELNCRADGLISRSEEPSTIKKIQSQLNRFNSAIERYFSDELITERAKKMQRYHVFTRYFDITGENASLESQYFSLPSGSEREEIIKKSQNMNVLGAILFACALVLIPGGIWWLASELEPSYHTGQAWNSSDNKIYLQKSIARHGAIDLDSNVTRYSDVSCEPTEIEGTWTCQAKAPQGAVSLAVQVGKKGEWRLREY